MMSLTFGLFTWVSDSGPQGPLVLLAIFVQHDCLRALKNPQI